MACRTPPSAANTRLFAKLMAAGRPLAEVVHGSMYRGVVTGANEVFIIDTPTRNQLVRADPGCAAIIKPMLRGEDLRPWYQESEGRWLVFTRRGTDIDAYPSVRSYLQQFRERLAPRPEDWRDSCPWPGRKAGPYKWYEIQDSIEYFEEFERPKIFWPNISKLPRFSWDDEGQFINDPGFFIPDAHPSLLGMLQSRTLWFAVSQICQPLRLRAGLWQYRMFTQFTSRLPIPCVSDVDREAIGDLAMRITQLARVRYALHQQTRHRVLTDLGELGKPLSQKLTAWWELHFPAFRAELQKVFKRDIPVADRNDWETWLAGCRAEHGLLTAEIVSLETELDERVYRLFDLTPEEIQIIEESTQYRYGEV